MIDENIYKIIGIICVCIIIYYICNTYYNKKIDIKNINKKFKNNKKLDNINFSTINIKNNLITIAEKQVITYINKYLEKINKRTYDLKKQNISNVKMSFNKKVNIYKISFMLDLKDIIVDILLYIDSKKTIFIRYINHIKENNSTQSTNDIIYFDLKDDIDITEIIKDKKKLYYLTNKIKSMDKKGYKPIIEDNKLKKVIEKFMNKNNTNSNNTNSNNSDFHNSDTDMNTDNLQINNTNSNNSEFHNIDSDNLVFNNNNFNTSKFNNIDYNNINTNIISYKISNNNNNIYSNSNLFHSNSNIKNTFLDGTPLCDGCNKDSNVISIIGEPFDKYSPYSKI